MEQPWCPERRRSARKLVAFVSSGVVILEGDDDGWRTQGRSVEASLQ